MTIVLLNFKGEYSSAGYNPVKDEVVVHQENIPLYVYYHENVHREMRAIGILTFLCAVGTLLGFALGTQKTKWVFFSYVLLSAFLEVTAYALTPFSEQGIYIAAILILGLCNLGFWNYFFNVSNIKKPISKSNLQDAIFPPIMAVVFWLV